MIKASVMLLIFDNTYWTPTNKHSRERTCLLKIQHPPVHLWCAKQSSCIFETSNKLWRKFKPRIDIHDIFKVKEKPIKLLLFEIKQKRNKPCFKIFNCSSSLIQAIAKSYQLVAPVHSHSYIFIRAVWLIHQQICFFYYWRDFHKQIIIFLIVFVI